MQAVSAFACANVADGLEYWPDAMVGHEQKTHRKHASRFSDTMTYCGSGTGHVLLALTLSRPANPGVVEKCRLSVRASHEITVPVAGLMEKLGSVSSVRSGSDEGSIGGEDGTVSSPHEGSWMMALGSHSTIEAMPTVAVIPASRSAPSSGDLDASPSVMYTGGPPCITWGIVARHSATTATPVTLAK